MRALYFAIALCACSSQTPPIDASTPDASENFDVCTALCKANDIVEIVLPCGSSGVKDAKLTGPCSSDAGGPGFRCLDDAGVPFVDCATIYVSMTTTVADTCGVEVDFDDGYVYTSSVTWTWVSSPCCSSLTASTTALVVTEADASCPADAGAD